MIDTLIFFNGNIIFRNTSNTIVQQIGSRRLWWPLTRAMQCEADFIRFSVFISDVFTFFFSSISFSSGTAVDIIVTRGATRKKSFIHIHMIGALTIATSVGPALTSCIEEKIMSTGLHKNQ